MTALIPMNRLECGNGNTGIPLVLKGKHVFLSYENAIGDEKYVYFYDSDGELLAKVDVPSRGINAVWKLDEHRIATRSDYQLLLWDSDKYDIIQAFQLPSSGLTWVELLAPNLILLAGSSTGIGTALWDLNTNELKYRLHNVAGWGLIHLDDWRAVTGVGRYLTYQNLRLGEVITQLDARELGRHVSTGNKYLVDGKFVVFLSRGVVWNWDFERGEIVSRVDIRSQHQDYSPQYFLPVDDFRWLSFGHGVHTCFWIWDRRSWEPFYKFVDHHQTYDRDDEAWKAINPLDAGHMSDSLLMSWSRWSPGKHSSVCFWDIESGQRIGEYDLRRNAAGFSAERENGTLAFWDEKSCEGGVVLVDEKGMRGPFYLLDVDDECHPRGLRGLKALDENRWLSWGETGDVWIWEFEDDPYQSEYTLTW